MSQLLTNIAYPLAAEAADSDAGTILLVDDEPAIQRFLKPALSVVGYDVIVAGSGAEALAASAARQPDLILLDLGLPDIDGLEVLVRLRQFYEGPIIVISGRSRDLDTITALDAGANDYVEKPFSLAKLIARIRRLRSVLTTGIHGRDQKVDPQPLQFQRSRAFLCGKDLNLTRKQYQLLLVLARNEHRIVPADEMLGAVWGPKNTKKIQYLRVYISILRSKFAGLEPPLTIKTVPGLGYRLTVGRQ